MKTGHRPNCIILRIIKVYPLPSEPLEGGDGLRPSSVALGQG